MRDRTTLDLEFRRFIRSTFLGFLVAVFSFIVGGVTNITAFFLIGGIAFLFAWISLMYLQFFGLKCFGCSTSLGWLTMYPRWNLRSVTLPWKASFPDRIKYCPFCGVCLKRSDE